MVKCLLFLLVQEACLSEGDLSLLLSEREQMRGQGPYFLSTVYFRYLQFKVTSMCKGGIFEVTDSNLLIYGFSYLWSIMVLKKKKKIK